MKHTLFGSVSFVLFASLFCGGCRQNDIPTPETAEAAFHLLKAAVDGNDGRGALNLLDTQTRWSIISILDDQKKICQLVREHYPKPRQGRELERCLLAASAKDEGEFFRPFAKKSQFWNELNVPAGSYRVLPEKTPDEVQVQCGKKSMRFCKEAVTIGRKSGISTWRFCGLRERLEQMKLKTSRDLLSTKENAEIFDRQ
jgi:hypothetical protein